MEKTVRIGSIALLLLLLLFLPGCQQQPEEPAFPAPLVQEEPPVDSDLPPAPQPQPRPTDHIHQPAETFYSTGRYLWENRVPPSGTLTVNGQNYKIKNAYPTLNRLLPLAYDPGAVCACPAEFSFETEYGRFEINLTEAFARCAEGQATLTPSQCAALNQLFDPDTVIRNVEPIVYVGTVPLPTKESPVTGHTHGPAETVRYATTQQEGLCGNFDIVLTVEKYEYYTPGISDAFFHLQELSYDQLRCGCPEEFRILGSGVADYAVNLTEAFARTSYGQTNLTEEQVAYFRALFARQEATLPQRNSPNGERN